ncbi:MAG TPA: hypothetical protein GX517_13880 [Alicyclobacillus sp.]|nr:hypothetical protein [Alicyclobacillus sp.]
MESNHFSHHMHCVALSKEMKAALFRMIDDPDTQIQPEEVCVSPAALVLYFKSLVNPTSNSAINEERMKSQFGRLIRILKGSVEQFGFVLPVIVLLTGPENPMFHRWAGDQDWHRGDFALYPVNEQLSAAKPCQYDEIFTPFLHIAPIQRPGDSMLMKIDKSTLRDQLKYELTPKDDEDSELFNEYRNLIQVVVDAIEDGGVDVKQVLMRWSEDRQQEIEQLLQEG